MTVRDWQRTGYSIAAMRSLAQRMLPKPIFDFADGGAEDERTLRRNEDAFAQWNFLPRPLNGAVQRDLSLTLFGARLSLPVVIGPTGLAGLFCADGERATARAAAAAGTAYCLSHGSVCTLEALSELGTSPRWMQVFVYKDRPFTWEMIDRASAAGYDALVLTIDNQLMGNRERDVRNHFGIPPRFTAGQLLGMTRQLPWLWSMRGALRRLTLGNYVRPGSTLDFASLAGKLASLLDPALNWDDVRAIRDRWKGTLLLKGVLHPEDAVQAASSGVDGIVVSNHGGRQLDGAISSIEALPGIVRALAEQHADLAVLLDGGVRRGADVAKALALGARAVLLGRPQLWGLAVAGEAGVAHVLEIYRRELDRTMGLIGASNLAQIDASVLSRRERD